MKSKLVLIVVAVMCLIQGCQKSPEEDAVVNKNKDILSEAEQLEESADEQQIFPEQKIDEFTTMSGEIKVSVKAEINGAEDSFSILRVKPREINEQELKVWADFLFEGQTAYEPLNQLTKAQIENEILWRRQKLNDREGLLEEVGGNGEDVELYIDVYQEQIAAYEKEYESAPDETERKESDWTFHPYDYYNKFTALTGGSDPELSKTMRFCAETHELNGHVATIDAVNRSEDDYQIHSISFYYLDEEKMTDIAYKETTEQEVINIAEEVIAKLDLGTWNLQDMLIQKDVDEHSTTLHYTYAYNQMPSLWGNEVDLKSQDIYAANVRYETLEIRIINGIVRNVTLDTPMELVSNEKENVAVLTFEEAYNLFKDKIKTELSKSKFFNYEEMNDRDFQAMLDEADVSLNITNINQGLFRIKIKDNNEEYRMIPAWGFDGSVIVDGEDWGKGNILMINAVDGSVINTDLGY